MARNGRIAGVYEGKAGGYERRYQPGQKCKECGMPAAFMHLLCHDCLCEESNVEYIPNPEEIRAECEKIRAEWSAIRWRHESGYKPLETQIVKLVDLQ